jgi:MFS family permease
MVTTTAAPAVLEPTPEPWPPRLAAYRLVAYALAVIMLGTTVPTPLYAIYQERLHLSNLTVTVIFAAYAAAVLVTSTIFGRASDRHGRKPVFLVAVGLAVASASVFLIGGGLPGLLLGRLLSGSSVGLILGTATATLIELQPASERRHAELTSTFANMAGLAIGPLLSGVLAEYGPAPTDLVYILLLAFLAPTLLLAAIPETGPGTRANAAIGPAAPRRPLAQQPPVTTGKYRAVLISTGATVFTAFAVQGLLSSLAPSFLASELGEHSHALAGMAAFALFASAALAQLLVPRLGPQRGMRTGLAVVPIALGMLIAAVMSTSLPTFLAATALVGLGSGLAFASALALLGTVSRDETRAGLMSTYFAIGFAGLTVPVIGAGILVDHLSVELTTTVFASIVTALAAVAITTLRRTRPTRRAGGIEDRGPLPQRSEAQRRRR